MHCVQPTPVLMPRPQSIQPTLLLLHTLLPLHNTPPPLLTPHLRLLPGQGTALVPFQLPACSLSSSTPQHPHPPPLLLPPLLPLGPQEGVGPVRARWGCLLRLPQRLERGTRGRTVVFPLTRTLTPLRLLPLRLPLLLLLLLLIAIRAGTPTPTLVVAAWLRQRLLRSAAQLLRLPTTTLLLASGLYPSPLPLPWPLMPL